MTDYRQDNFDLTCGWVVECGFALNAGIAPDTITFTSLIKCCAKLGDVAGCLTAAACKVLGMVRFCGSMPQKLDAQFRMIPSCS